MRRKSAFPRSLLALALSVVSLAGSSARGGEPVEQFLAALHQRHYHDTALDYLTSLAGQTQLAADVRERLPYDEAQSLVVSATAESNLPKRDILLARAEELFTKFTASHPGHELSPLAKNELAGVLLQRGRIEAHAASGTPDAKGSDAKEPRLATARERFEQARRQLAAAEDDMVARLDNLPKLVTPDETDLAERKRKLGAELVHVRLLRASVDYELAGTFEAGSPKAKKHFQDAAKSYATLHETYRTRSAGLLARLWEGRCHQQLGQFKQALGCYQELIDLPASPDTLSVRAKATRGALECWTHDGQKKYREAIECGERWESHAPADAHDADSLAIRYLTGLAYQSQSKTLPAKDPNRKKLAGSARQYVDAVARQPGEYQRPAKMMLVALAAGKGPKETGGQGATFAEAYEQGRQALEQMQQAAADLTLARGGTDKAAIEKLEKRKRETTAAAVEALRTAVNKSDAKTPLEDLNSARYYLCFLAWDMGQLQDAAVLGEFLATRYSDTVAGRQGARIALAAYVRMHGETKGDDREFERAQVRRIAELIFKRWPNQEESDDAALTILNFAVAERQFDEALACLSKVSAESPRRGQAELRAGQALWSAYLRATQLPLEDRPKEEQLNELKKNAQEILAQGIVRMEKAPAVDAALAAAVLSLAQIDVETGQPDKAIAWLENAKMGPLTLVKANNPAAAREAFANETYKIALRAYIAVQPQQIKKAEEVMDLLEKHVQKSGDAAAVANLTAIYISLGRELQQHLQELSKAGKKKELETVSSAFEVFLDRITKRETGGSYSSLNWVGETYYSLGKGLDEGGAGQSTKTKGYFQKASVAYEKMLAIAAKDPKFKDQPETLVGIRLRIADCRRRSGDFDAAIKTLIGILQDKAARLDVQVKAAELYQIHGATDPTGYALAITGSTPGRDGKNIVWGWAKISQLTTNRPEFEGTFHQARLSMAEARYKYALTHKDEAKRKKILEAAIQDLWFTYKLYPKLGGEETSARYERLLKQIQKGLGKPETGLKEFEERDAAVTPAT
jgi:tetratricopeptide (TPR) repeat protein